VQFYPEHTDTDIYQRIILSNMQQYATGGQLALGKVASNNSNDSIFSQD